MFLGQVDSWHERHPLSKAAEMVDSKKSVIDRTLRFHTFIRGIECMIWEPRTNYDRYGYYCQLLRIKTLFFQLQFEKVVYDGKYYVVVVWWVFGKLVTFCLDQINFSVS